MRRSPLGVAPADEVPMDTTAVHSGGDEDAGPAADAGVSFKRRNVRDGSRMGRVRSWLRDARRPRGSPPLQRTLLEARAGRVADDDAGSSYFHALAGPPDTERNTRHVSAVPSLMRSMRVRTGETPIPWLPYAVVCLLMFGEFCSAGVAGPFLFFMLEGMHVGGEGDVGFWAGIVSAVFFFAQFLTSLLWANAAERYGRRPFLQLSLFGSTVTLLLFGVSTNLPMVLFFRLAQGFFNGAVGVARGAIRDLTDETNEGRAYAQMGFCWGMGGIVGPILGGVLEHPVQKYPRLFGHSVLLRRYPYLLPCLAGSLFTTLGAVLSLFLARDGAQGAIRLEEDEASVAHPDNPSGFSAYAPSAGTVYAPVNRGSFLSAPSVQGMSISDAGASVIDRARLSLAERFVLANDDAVLRISDLWLAAAANPDAGAASIAEDDAAGDAEAFDDDTDAGDPMGAFGYGDTPPLFGTSFGGRERAPQRAPHAYLPPFHYARSHGARTSVASVSETNEEQGDTTPKAGDSTIHVEQPAAPPAAPAAPVSLWTLLPLVVIMHYGLLSFHSSTFEQVFMAFLVTPEASGGLGLNAGHYAVLISFMALCQLLFQFYAYPSLGPPKGPLTHLAVMRLGLALYLPCYTLFPLLRSFLHPSTDALVMGGMIAIASVRWLANVLSFTAVMVLLNAATPPELTGFANGLAQTVSSAARCVGPIFGGAVWAQSIAGDWRSHRWPFNYHYGFWAAGLVAFAGFLHSWAMRRSV